MTANEITAHCQRDYGSLPTRLRLTVNEPNLLNPRQADLFETAGRLIGRGISTISRPAIFYESETLFAGTATAPITQGAADEKHLTLYPLRF